MTVWQQWVQTIVSMAISAGVTWVAAWRYYKKAGDELRAESVRLRTLIGDTLIGLERAGLLTRKVGPDGEILIDRQGSADITLPSLNAPPSGPVVRPDPTDIERDKKRGRG